MPNLPSSVNDFSRALLEAAPDAIVVVDGRGTIALVNRTTELMFGYQRAELLGQPVELLVPERFRARHRQHRDRYHAAPRVRAMNAAEELLGLRKDGSEFPVEISLSPIPTEAGMFVFSAIRDVTQRNNDITARQRSEAMLAEREAQLIAAAEIQKYLQPKQPVTVPGLSIAGRCYPAEYAAGDHFDFVRLPNRSVLVALSDVSGHGVGPALLTAAFRAHLHDMARNVSEPTEIVSQANVALHEETTTSMFMTLTVVAIDPGSRRLTYVNAGHPPGVVLHRSGRRKVLLEGRNLALGIDPEFRYHGGPSVRLEAEDLLFLYTDGLLEARAADGAMFGLTRAVDIVRTHHDRTPAEIIRAVHAALCEFTGTDTLDDDVTIVVVKVRDGNA
jgi:PAS domain S-box-containing protein